MSKLFGSISEVDPHNKSRQSSLVLKLLWVTYRGWLLSCTTASMITTVTNLWKLFCCGVKRYHYEKLIGIREFWERLALYCFNNETGTPENNIRTLDEINYGETVSTCWGFCFPDLIFIPQRSTVFLTKLPTVLHSQPLLQWLLLLGISILLKNKDIGR